MRRFGLAPPALIITTPASRICDPTPHTCTADVTRSCSSVNGTASLTAKPAERGHATRRRASSASPVQRALSRAAAKCGTRSRGRCPLRRSRRRSSLRYRSDAPPTRRTRRPLVAVGFRAGRGGQARHAQATFGGVGHGAYDARARPAIATTTPGPPRPLMLITVASAGRNHAPARRLLQPLRPARTVRRRQYLPPTLSRQYKPRAMSASRARGAQLPGNRPASAAPSSVPSMMAEAMLPPPMKLIFFGA